MPAPIPSGLEQRAGERRLLNFVASLCRKLCRSVLLIQWQWHPPLPLRGGEGRGEGACRTAPHGPHGFTGKVHYGHRGSIFLFLFLCLFVSLSSYTLLASRKLPREGWSYTF